MKNTFKHRLVTLSMALLLVLIVLSAFHIEHAVLNRLLMAAVIIGSLLFITNYQKTKIHEKS